MNTSFPIAFSTPDRIPRRVFLHRLCVGAALIGASGVTTAGSATPLLPATAPVAPAAPGPAATERETEADDPAYYADPGWSM